MMQDEDSEKTLLRGVKYQRHVDEDYQNDEDLAELSSNKRVKRSENTQSMRLNKEYDDYPFISSESMQQKKLNMQLRCTNTMRTIDRSSKAYGGAKQNGDSNRGRRALDEKEDNFLQSVSLSEEEEEEEKDSGYQGKEEHKDENIINSQQNCNLSKEAVKTDKMKLSKEYLILEVLGKGGQGRVATFLDGKTNSVIALKEFNIQSEFERECSIYNFVQEKKELHDYVNLMIDQDNLKQQIQLQMGSCSLFELYLALREHYQIWEESILMRIFVQITKGILAFRKIGFFHGDIKPQNVMFFPVESVYNAYSVKFIDLGAAGMQNSDYFDYYSEQFCSVVELDKVMTTDRTLTSQEITVAEIYSLVRTIWLIACFTKKASQEFKEIRDLSQGIQRIAQSYPALSQLIQKVIDAKGDLNRIDDAISNIPEVSREDIKVLKLDDDMQENILRIIGKKKERFINSHSEEELEELFEIFSCLGLDQRALEAFSKLENSYENLLEKFIEETKKINDMKKQQSGSSSTGDKTQSQFDSSVSESMQEMKENLGNGESYVSCVASKDKSGESQVTSSEQENPSQLFKSTLSQQETGDFPEASPPMNNLLKKISIIKESVILLNEKGELEKAMQWNRLLNELFSEGKLKSEKECILQSIQYAILLNSRGKIEEALKIAKSAKSDFRTVLKRESKGDKLLFQQQQETDVAYGQICQVMGRLFIEMNSLSSGIKNLKQALKIFESIKVKSWELDNLTLTTLIKLSQASGQLKQNINALNYVDRAAVLCEEMYGKRENKHVAMCLNMKSYILKQQGQFEKALNLQEQCLRIRMQIHNGQDHRCIATSLSLISMLESKLGRYSQAIKNALHCYNMKMRLFYSDNPYHSQITFSLRNIAQIYENQQSWDMAEDYYLKTYENTVKNGDVHQQEVSLKSLIRLYQLIKQKEKAQPFRLKLEEIKLDLTLKKSASVNSNSTDNQPSRKQSEVLDYVPSLSPRKNQISEQSGRKTNINQADQDLELDSLMETQKRAQRTNKKRESLTEISKKDKKDSSNKPKCSEIIRKKSVKSKEKDIGSRIKETDKIAARSKGERKTKSKSRESKLVEIKNKKSCSQNKDSSLNRVDAEKAAVNVDASKRNQIASRSQQKKINKQSDKELSHQSSKCSDQSIGSVHLEKQQSAPQERKRQLKLQYQFSQRSSSKTPTKRKRSSSTSQIKQSGRNRRSQNNKEIGRVKSEKIVVEEKKELSLTEQKRNTSVKSSGSETEDEKERVEDDDQGHSSEGWYGKNEEIIEVHGEVGLYEVIQGPSNPQKKRQQCVKLEERKSRNKNQSSGKSKSKVRSKKKAENQFTISHQVENIDSSDIEETRALSTSQFRLNRHTDRIGTQIKSAQIL